MRERKNFEAKGKKKNGSQDERVVSSQNNGGRDKPETSTTIDAKKGQKVSDERRGKKTWRAFQLRTGKKNFGAQKSSGT